VLRDSGQKISNPPQVSSGTWGGNGEHVTLNEVKGTIASMAPFALRGVT